MDYTVRRIIKNKRELKECKIISEDLKKDILLGNKNFNRIIIISMKKDKYKKLLKNTWFRECTEIKEKIIQEFKLGTWDTLVVLDESARKTAAYIIEKYDMRVMPFEIVNSRVQDILSDAGKILVDKYFVRFVTGYLNDKRELMIKANVSGILNDKEFAEFENIENSTTAFKIKMAPGKAGLVGVKDTQKLYSDKYDGQYIKKLFSASPEEPLDVYRTVNNQMKLYRFVKDIYDEIVDRYEDDIKEEVRDYLI